MFVVVDLFRNVPEFDRVRPKWRTYEQMRAAAHEISGEPWLEPLPPGPPVFTLAAALDAVATADLDELVATAQGGADPRVRGKALRALAERGQRDVIRAVARDGPEKVRAEAARCLGRAGDLEGLDALANDPSPRVRRGVRLGYAELGTAAAVRRLLDAGAEEELGRVARAEAVPALAEAAPRSPAACKALGNTKAPEAVPVLRAVLAKPGAPAAVRAAATESLGRLGAPEALPEVLKACRDASPAVAREAEVARQRLLRTR